jgi:hypothetical protein
MRFHLKHPKVRCFLMATTLFACLATLPGCMFAAGAAAGTGVGYIVGHETAHNEDDKKD